MAQEILNKHTGSQKDRKEKEQTRRELLAKYLYDVSKVFVAGMFLINMLSLFQGDTTASNFVSTFAGASASVGLAWAANRLLIY